jgi:hypothetical protein
MDLSGPVLSLSSTSAGLIAGGDFGRSIYAAPAGAARAAGRTARTSRAALRRSVSAGPAMALGTGAVHVQSGVAFIHPSDAGPPTATALGPTLTGALPLDSLRTLAWLASDDLAVQSVDVYLSRSGPSGPWELLAGCLPNTGLLVWKVTGPNTSNALMRVDAHDIAGNTTTAIGGTAFTIGAPALGVPGTTPVLFALSPASPNPVRGTSRIDFALPVRSRVTLGVYDVQGRLAAILADGELSAGRHALSLDAARLQTGLYFMRLRAPGAELERRVVVIR